MTELKPLSPRRILLVEDDPALGFLLEDLLDSRGFEVKRYVTVSTAWEAFGNMRFHLCILDVMLPFQNGFVLGEKIRSRDKHIPMMFLTARNHKSDQLKGFSVGADDYITKPFDEDLFLCRIYSLLKRGHVAQVPSHSQCYQLGSCTFLPGKQILRYQKHEQRLTHKENALLHLLCQHQGHILTREQALREIWGKNDYFLGRSLDVFISKLRKYLKKEPKVRIETIFGQGFMLVAPSPLQE